MFGGWIVQNKSSCRWSTVDKISKYEWKENSLIISTWLFPIRINIETIFDTPYSQNASVKIYLHKRIKKYKKRIVACINLK